MPTISITSLYRHPVKSFTPEKLDHLSITADGRVNGDRVLAFRLGGVAPADDIEWRQKHNYLALVNTPGMARMSLSFDDEGRRLRVDVDGLNIAEGSIDSGRESVAAAITDFALTLDYNPLSNQPDRQPLLMVGDGVNGRFHDSREGLVTLYSEESLNALAEKLGDQTLDGRRFRANIVVAGVNEPFEELSWVGKRVIIGDSEFRAVKPVPRCLATHVNPVTGESDRGVMGVLVENFTPEKPEFAVMLEPLNAPFKIEIGAELRVLG